MHEERKLHRIIQTQELLIELITPRFCGDDHLGGIVGGLDSRGRSCLSILEMSCAQADSLEWKASL